MRSALHKLFLAASSLPRATDTSSPAQAIEGRDRDYVTVGSLGEPVLLLTCTDVGATKRPPLVLRHLAVEYGVRYRIQTPSTQLEDSFVVVTLRGDDRALAEPFCLACDVLVGSLPFHSSATDVDNVVR